MAVSLLARQLVGTDVADATLAVSIAPGADLAADPATWPFVDVTSDVMFRSLLTISMGRSDEQSQAQTASCSFVLLNDSGDYTPRRPASPYYPNMRLGFPVKVVVDTTEVGAVELFTGYVDELAPTWDASTRVAAVTVTAKGTIQRLQQGNAPLQSAATRIALDETLTDTVAAYWPVTDGVGSSQVGSGLAGGAPMVISGGEMTFGAYDGIPGSEPLAEFGAGANLHGDVDNDRADTTGAAYFRCLMHSGTPLADLTPMMQWLFDAPSLVKWQLQYRTGGGLSLHGYARSGAEIFDSGPIGFTIDDAAYYLAFEAVQNGADIDVTLYVGKAGSGIGNQYTTTVTGRTLGKMVHYDVGGSGSMQGWGIGHIGVSNDIDWFFDAFDIVEAYTNETVTDRMVRVCAEAAVPLTLVGTSTLTMGPQPRGTLMDVLRDCEATDHGVLYDGVGFGLAYLARAERENAPTWLLLDIADGDLVPPFEPLENTRLVVNDVTAKKPTGSTARAVQPEGEPYAPTGDGGVGFYSSEYTVNPADDARLPGHASWLLHLGTVDLDRFPNLSLDFSASPQIAERWLTYGGVGVRASVDGVPATGGNAPDLFVEGYSTTISPHDWRVEANCAPAAPYDTARVVLARVDTTGSELDAPASAGATSVSVAAARPWSTSAGTFDLNVGGYRVECTAISGASSPQTFAISALPGAVPAGADVRLWKPAIVSLELS